MSYVRIWVHCVWTTYRRIPFMRGEIRDEVIHHIRTNARQKGIYIDHVNGYYEHLHALISMGGQQNISDIMHKIKGESSYWINKNKLTKTKFAWQDDFWAVSIGIPQLKIIRNYIRGQFQHHDKITVQEELDLLQEEYNLQKILD